MRCGEKKYTVETSDGMISTIRARTQVEARKKAKKICGENVEIHSVRATK